jgi:hypothetical protein
MRSATEPAARPCVFAMDDYNRRMIIARATPQYPTLPA